MKYEIVELEQKTVVGVSAITTNDDPNMGKIIGGLWEQLYQEGISTTIKNRRNEYAIGLYSDYVKDQYCVTTGHEVIVPENEELTVKTIPAGTYAKFSIYGNMMTVVAETWNEIWNTDLERSFTGDFEEYLNADCEHADINIYIALK